MRIRPVITEKSIKEAKEGNYTFYVDRKLNKYQIKELVNKTFNVNAVKVRTVNLRSRKRKNFRGNEIVIKARKKAIVSLKGKEKIDLFEEEKKKK